VAAREALAAARVSALGAALTNGKRSTGIRVTTDDQDRLIE
jgi:hypothetical protein